MENGIDLILWNKKGIVDRASISMDFVSKRISAERLSEILPQLKKGNEVARNEIVMGHLGLTISIAAQYAYRYPKKKYDLVGCALEALVECVDRVRTGQTVLKDDRIDWYIGAYVKGKILSYIRKDCVVKPREERDPKERVIQIFLNLTTIERLLDGKKTEGVTDSELKKAITRAPDHHTFLLIKEVLASKRLTSREKKILEMFYQGYTDEEIAHVIGLSRTRVTQIRLGAFSIIKKQYGEEDV